jgi:maleylacetoacetate isomerase
MRLLSRSQNSAGERVRIALNLKEIEYEYTHIGSSASSEYRKLNPQGLLPTLEVDGRCIAQSSAILEYLEETHPERPLLPANPILRGQARAFAGHIASEMHAITVLRIRKFLLEDLEVSDEGIAHWLSHWMRLGLTALEETLAARQGEWPFCFGEAPGWADLHLIPQLANARRLGCDVSAYSRLLAVETNCVGLEAFARARPEAQPDYPESAN